MLKRKLDEAADDGEELDNATTSNGQSESDNSNCSAGSTDALAPEVASGPSPPKRMKKKVNFKGVTVFYFPRKQGFTCVPSEGGSTLGMSEKHSFIRDFTLSDYTKEQKRMHRTILAEQKRQGKLFPSPLLASSLPSPETEDDVSTGTESDSEYDDYYFLQPLPIRQRRVLLRTAGVKKIDNDEKDECRDIRVSRNVCGCDCKLFCDPAVCACSLAGIQCQVDRLSFPCGCTKDGCCNPAGRIEFNPIRVRTHFIHTLMRIELERKDTECPQGSSGAATTSSCFSPKASSAGVEIDVVGAIGEEDGEASTEVADGGSDDSCSGASTDAGTSSGLKVLKSRLKAKKAESIDLNMFNSNEKGSCRDCQNTDMCNVMMNDLKFSMVTQQQQRQQKQHQQQQMISAALGPQPGYPGTLGPQIQQHHHLGLSPGISLLHPPPSLSQPPLQQQSPQHMLLFNDGDEEAYQAESTTSMYFDIDDNSYPEVNDSSSDTLQSRPFSTLTPPGFSRKFQGTQIQPFAATNLINNSSTGSVHSHTRSMNPQISLLSPGCIKRLQMNSLGNSSRTSSCNSLENDQQHSCGLMTHALETSAASCSKSLLRPPFVTHAHILPSGNCVGSEGGMTPRAGISPQSGHLACTQLDSNLKHSASNNNSMIPRATANFQSKYAHTEISETAAHGEVPVYKLDSSVLSNQAYSPSMSSVKSAGFLNHSNNFSTQASDGFGNLNIAVVSTDGSASFQHSSCWSTSLTGPAMRECFNVVTTSPAAAPSSAIQRTSQVEISCNPNPQKEPQPYAIVLEPLSPVSSATTYATMTATTHDRLAAHCPGISSHVDGRTEPHTSIASDDSTTTFPSYPMTGMDSDVSSLVETSQNLLYDLPYSDTSKIEPLSNLSATFVKADIGRECKDAPMDNFLNQPSHVLDTSFPLVTSPLLPLSQTVSTPLTSEFLSTSPVCSDEISTSLPSSFSPTSLTLSVSSTALSGGDQPVAGDHTSGNYLSTSRQLNSPSEQPLLTCSEEILHSQRHTTTPNVSSVTKDMNKREASLETGKLETTTSDNSNMNDFHLGKENTRSNLKDHEGESTSSWRADDVEHLNDTETETLPLLTASADSDQTENPEGCGIVSISSVSTLQSGISSSSTMSSSSPKATKEGGKEEKQLSQDFGETMKESIIEMVLV